MKMELEKWRNLLTLPLGYREDGESRFSSKLKQSVLMKGVWIPT